MPGTLKTRNVVTEQLASSEILAPSEFSPDSTRSERASPVLVELLRVLHRFPSKIPNFDPFNPKFDPKN